MVDKFMLMEVDEANISWERQRMSDGAGLNIIVRLAEVNLKQRTGIAHHR
jgi:hypothetical protein